MRSNVAEYSAVFVALLLTASLAVCSKIAHGAATPTRPFPQHVRYASGVILPDNVSQSTRDSTVLKHYNSWRANYVKSVPQTSPVQEFVQYDCVPATECKTNEGCASAVSCCPATVSEAHGYGMVISAYMANRTDFDAMFHYFKAHPSKIASHLMAWKQVSCGGHMVDVEGVDSATDGDLDIAYSLLLADKQWGSSGAIDYKAEALAVMGDILAKDVNRQDWNLLCGDWAYGSDMHHTRPSDFMVDHFLAFAAADTAHHSQWMNVYRKICSIVKYQYNFGGSAKTGLMPDFMVKSGSNFVPVSGTYLETPHDGDFDYNACRTPWRLPMAFILSGKTDILQALRTQDSWIQAKTGGIPTNIMAGYYVKNGPNGTAYQTFDDLCFTAPFAVEAMINSNNQAWLNSLWTSITGGDYPVRVDYYGDSIRMQVLLVISGNWWLPGTKAAANIAPSGT
ncbi:MAG TPA: glycosyl hydrolase family 8 [Syntrophobacteraceae bacterium]|nr:glycosyl hydrolase family 8 [Syntrophobacteraceae bacterium]